jgi:hypothetical protein
MHLTRGKRFDCASCHGAVRLLPASVRAAYDLKLSGKSKLYARSAGRKDPPDGNGDDTSGGGAGGNNGQSSGIACLVAGVPIVWRRLRRWT